MILFIIWSLICKVGILDLPVSVAGDVISPLAYHTLDLSMSSIYCAQCSALVLHISPKYCIPHVSDVIC